MKFVSEEMKFPSHCMFNREESGISTAPNKIPKVIYLKGKRLVSKVASIERGQTITVACYINLIGLFVPHAILFPRRRIKPELLKDDPEGTFLMISELGS